MVAGVCREANRREANRREANRREANRREANRREANRPGPSLRADRMIADRRVLPPARARPHPWMMAATVLAPPVPHWTQQVSSVVHPLHAAPASSAAVRAFMRQDSHPLFTTFVDLQYLGRPAMRVSAVCIISTPGCLVWGWCAACRTAGARAGGLSSDPCREAWRLSGWAACVSRDRHSRRGLPGKTPAAIAAMEA
ncbi:MAG: hypothetical protein WDW38_001970 [Sanguina aurantia]